MKNMILYYMTAASIFLATCSHKGETEQASITDENYITITQEQFTTGNISIGEPVRMTFEDLVRCNGNIVTDPSGRAMISTPVQGIVKKIYCSAGQKVNQGQVLFDLSGNEFIELQKDLAETASQLKRLKSEYERIRSLYDEKIGTEKELIQAESEFKASNAMYSALKMKIKFLGLDENKIEDGDFYESFSLKSPINGFVSQLNVLIGQYADLQTTLAEVFDSGRFQLRLAIFEKDFGNLKETQKIRFNLLGDTVNFYSARLRSIGRNVDPDTKTIICYAVIDDLNSKNFVNNAYVEAAIVTKTDTVNAVPEESVVKTEGSSYILEFIKNENNIYYLKRTKAEVGRITEGYAELLNIPDNIKLITKGAYNISIE
jgi:cobalt-zinc-cadmium efflux system membrane fusion protein